MNTPMFALCIALFAITNGLLGPSNDAMLKSIVPMDRFAKAQAIRETRESCVELSNGIIRGFLYTVSAWCPFMVSAVLYGIAGITTGQLPSSQVDHETARNDLAGNAVGWLLQQPGLGFTAVMGMAVVCAMAGLVVALIGPLRRISTPDRWSESEL